MVSRRCRRVRAAFQHCDEETVGSEPVGIEPEHVGGLRQNSAAARRDRCGPDITDRKDPVVGTPPQQGRHPFLVLLRKQGTGGRRPAGLPVGSASRPGPGSRPGWRQCRRDPPRRTGAGHRGRVATRRCRCTERRPGPGRTVPRWRRVYRSASAARTRRSTLCNPARATRAAARSSRADDTSSASTRPRLRISAPSTRVLPPAPAQKSATCMPGSTAVSRAASCAPSSWISTSPSRRAASPRTRGLPSQRRPNGDQGVGLVASPARSSLRRTASRPVPFRGLILRSSAASRVNADMHSANRSPSTGSSLFAIQSGHSALTGAGMSG